VFSRVTAIFPFALHRIGYELAMEQVGNSPNSQTIGSVHSIRDSQSFEGIEDSYASDITE
jgi:hypothetical protein